MRRPIPVLLAVLAAACAGEAPTAAVPERAAVAAPAAPSTSSALPDVPSTGKPVARTPPGDGLNEIPQAACEPGNHAEFVNAFAQFVPQRSLFATEAGRAQLGAFDVALVDYRWQRASDGVALEVVMDRSDARLDVAATPVERDAEDNPVRTLGPTRNYVFEHRDGCWRYAGPR